MPANHNAAVVHRTARDRAAVFVRFVFIVFVSGQTKRHNRITLMGVSIVPSTYRTSILSEKATCLLRQAFYIFIGRKRKNLNSFLGAEGLGVIKSG